jgi:hypothetical protein
LTGFEQSGERGGIHPGVRGQKADLGYSLGMCWIGCVAETVGGLSARG